MSLETQELFTVFFCFVHCLLDFFQFEVSDTFKASTYPLIGMNFVTSYLNTGAGYLLPPKMWFVLIGFVLYSLVQIFDYAKNLMGFTDFHIPELVVDIALYQYYVMTLVSFLALLFFSETYTKPRFTV